MKKYFPVLIGVFTLFWGFISILIWYSIYPATYSFNEVISAKVPKTNYCELINNPYKYNNKIVRLNTNLNWFMHGIYLDDKNCLGNGDSGKTAISFNEEKREELFKYVESYRQKGEIWKPLEIIAIGVFRYQPVLNSSDSIGDRTNLHFEIYSIEYSTR